MGTGNADAVGACATRTSHTNAPAHVGVKSGLPVVLPHRGPLLLESNDNVVRPTGVMTETSTALSTQDGQGELLAPSTSLAVGRQSQRDARETHVSDTLQVRCVACDRLGHVDETSPECPFFGRRRGELDWAPQHADAALGDAVPHMSETNIRIFADGVEQERSRPRLYWYQHLAVEILVDNSYFGLGRASGDGCNCLIDTLRQKLPDVICCVPEVRRRLEALHPEIIPGDYLELHYWEDIVNLLGACNRVRAVTWAWAVRFQIVCVDLTWIGNGDVEPRGPPGSRTRLYIARVNQNHFIPLHRLHARATARASASSVPQTALL